MSINFRVPGNTGLDNAVYAVVETQDRRQTLLFDCGENCLNDLRGRETRAIDWVFFSHSHIAHLAGFDALLRHHYRHPHGPLKLLGQADAQSVGHRLQGVSWNLLGNLPGAVQTVSIDKGQAKTIERQTSMGFSREKLIGSENLSGDLLTTNTFSLEVFQLDHGTPCSAYLLKENSRLNINTLRLAELGLTVGVWLKQVKDLSLPGDAQVDVSGSVWSLADLREHLVQSTPGDSVAYLTGFSMNAHSEERLVDWFSGCKTMICENNFRNADRHLATASNHLVSDDVGRITSKAGVEDATAHSFFGSLRQDSEGRADRGRQASFLEFANAFPLGT